MLQLIRKYNKPTPRYTSYPTVPMWNDPAPAADKWLASVKRIYNESGTEGISLYIHLPFCEELCTYCACNKRITINHAVETRYMEALLAEWSVYLNTLGEKPLVREIHLGGGTPTFFRPEHLGGLIDNILKNARVSDNPEFSFEGHPNNTTREHLQTLAIRGFRRVSFGIQDLNPEVQRAINRIQPFENVERVTNWARETGYTSVNFDFVYGLPFQDSKNLVRTLQLALRLKPDRIAFYSYAHVPWTSPGQRAYDLEDLPNDIEKVSMYLIGRQVFINRGYTDIGMDHFALPGDSLVTALENHRLHRNFMGYTENPGDLLIGLGCSSISDSHYAYVQNNKNVEAYQDMVLKGELPLVKGHFLDGYDIETRRRILEIACNRRLDWSEISPSEQLALEDLEHDGILRLNENSFTLTERGLLFMRNVCAVFDRYQQHSETNRMFSQAI